MLFQDPPTQHHHHDSSPFQSIPDSLQSLCISFSGLEVCREAAKPQPEPAIRYPDPIVANPRVFPSGNNVVFGHSGFFKNNHPKPIDLPSPRAVRAHAYATNKSGHGYSNPNHSTTGMINIAVFESLGLLVKYGPGVSVAEAKTLVLVKRLLSPHGVPVPEVYGWRRDATVDGRAGSETFIYMELVGAGGEQQTATLRDSWGFLSEAQRTSVCRQLGHAVGTLRRLSQGSNTDPFLGTVDYGPLADRKLLSYAGLNNATFMGSDEPPNPAGPFANVTAFHDWIVTTACESSGALEDRLDGVMQLRWRLPDDVPVVFSHGNLDPGNIILGPPLAGATGEDASCPRIIAITGWGQAGWYPAYWEPYKAMLLSSSVGRHGGEKMRAAAETETAADALWRGEDLQTVFAFGGQADTAFNALGAEVADAYEFMEREFCI